MAASEPGRIARTMYVMIAAIVAVVLVAVVGMFQLALALGAPWGTAAWGGANAGALPTRLRIASGVAAVLLYPLIIVFVLGSAEVIDVDWLPTGSTGMWIIAGFFTLGAFMNAISRSKRERVWAPVSLAVAVCSAIVAVGA